MAEQNAEPSTTEANAPPKPGETIVPAGAPRPEHLRVSALDLPDQQPTPPAQTPEPQPPPPPLLPPQPIAPPTPIQPPPAAQPLPPQQPPPQQLAQPAQLEDPDIHPHTENDGTIVWTASEFVAHEKSSGWYGALVGASILISGLVYLLTKDIVSSIVILFCAFIFGIFAARKPRQLQYRIGDQGVSIGPKHYSFQEFKSFTVAPDGAFSSIVFMPLKRFATLKTIYYAPEDEDLIVDILADCLPFEDHAPDAVDRLMSRIRF